jgi:hypothetical protein
MRAHLSSGRPSGPRPRQWLTSAAAVAAWHTTTTLLPPWWLTASCSLFHAASVDGGGGGGGVGGRVEGKAARWVCLRQLASTPSPNPHPRLTHPEPKLSQVFPKVIACLPQRRTRQHRPGSSSGSSGSDGGQPATVSHLHTAQPRTWHAHACMCEYVDPGDTTNRVPVRAPHHANTLAAACHGSSPPAQLHTAASPGESTGPPTAPHPGCAALAPPARAAAWSGSQGLSARVCV